MIDFFSTYGLPLLSVLLSVLSIICLILKRSKLVFQDTIFEKVSEKLPVFIRLAESSFNDGETKKSFVLGLCFSLLKDLTGESQEKLAKAYGDRLSKSIEAILSTPLKKGISFDDN